MESEDASRPEPVDLSDPVHRAIMLIIFGLADIAAASVLVMLLVRWSQFWLMAVAGATVAGATWLLRVVTRTPRRTCSR